MRFIELFAGIGGFRLGLEPLGWKCVWANEIDPYACKVYRKNFGDKELFEGDIRDVDPNDIPEFDMLTAGFPCQDISNAGKREGIKEGNRSGLWFEIVRIIRSRSPRWVFLENVAALTIRGLDIVLRDLSESGYDAEWDIISAASQQAPHRRQRIWIIAYPKSIRLYSNIFQKRISFKSNKEVWRQAPRIYLSDIGNTYPEIPQYLRVDNGLSEELDTINERIKCLGNSVVPQVVTHVGRRIQDYINDRS